MKNNLIQVASVVPKIKVGDVTYNTEQIISMDYLMENVIGEIPPYDALSDLAKATVQYVGVEGATKDQRS